VVPIAAARATLLRDPLRVLGSRKMR